MIKREICSSLLVLLLKLNKKEYPLERSEKQATIVFLNERLLFDQPLQFLPPLCS